MQPLTTFGAIAAQSQISGNWAVQCLRCGEDVGTMSSEILREAVFRTAHKGGIICPACRKRSCTDCGVQMEEGVPLPEPRICIFCDLDRAEARTSPCLSSISYLKPDGSHLEVMDRTGGRWMADIKPDMKGYVKMMLDAGYGFNGKVFYQPNLNFQEDDINTCMNCGSQWRPHFIDRCKCCGSKAYQPMQLVPWWASSEDAKGMLDWQEDDEEREDGVGNTAYVEKREGRENES